jgi:hypothetical protein
MRNLTGITCGPHIHKEKITAPAPQIVENFILKSEPGKKYSKECSFANFE